MEATNETGNNPAGAQSSAEGATLSGGLADNVTIDGDIITIYGIKYSGALFRGFGFQLREDEYFKFLRRVDGAVHLQTFRKPPFDVGG